MPLPRPLTPQSRIAIAAPASAALDRADTEAGLAVLRDRGLTLETGRAFASPYAYLSGSDEERADELNALLARNDLDAIVCLRGGYGLLRILDQLDYEAARKTPKLIVGYSDITALHLALYTKAGLPGLSGPMVAPDWPQLDADSEAQFWAVAGGRAGEPLVGPGGEPLVPMRDGIAEGVLLGGNLALTAALLGTPYLPDLEGAILFLEDVGESPYRIDGLLARLRLAGVLGQLGGLVLGAFTGSEPPKDRPSFSVEEVLDQYAAYVNGPVASGLVYGHFARKITVPVGVQARLTVHDGNAELVPLTPVAAP
ncbi:MAG: LD-carboxypeptidase [Rubricoccaceae bacterium]